MESIKRISQDLHSFLYSDRCISLLPKCGWNDGGCRSLMVAVRWWLGENNTSLYQILKKDLDDGHSEHVVVKVGKYFIDSDGISDESELRKRWICDEGLGPIIIREFCPIKEPNRGAIKPFYIEYWKIKYLEELLSSHFNADRVIKLLND